MKELVNVNVPKPKGVEEVKAPEEKKKTVGERIIEAEEDALVHEATKKAHGLGPGSGEQPESLAVQIVTKSMTQQQDAIKTMENDAKELRQDIKAANDAKANMQTAMLQDMLTRIESAQVKLNESTKAAQATGAPVSAFDGYKQVKDELSTLVADIQKTQPSAEAQHPGMSDATQVRLKELELQQQQVLAQITADNTRAHEQFQLQMLEFKDNKDVRHMEYQDKRHFREEGLHGVSDLVAALGAGVSEKGGPGTTSNVETKPGQQSESEEAEAGAYVSSFKCGICGGEVPVQEDATVAKCPNPECNATFTIKAKE